MADPVIFIVGKLNEEPFRKKLSLVDFDEKSPVELIQILNDVFAELDGTMACDVRDASRETLASKMMNMLTILKFKLPREDQREDFERGLGVGDKSVVYPVLHWLLERLKQHGKRAYVAKYLLPVDVPPEYLQDEALADSFQHLKMLQSEFKTAHKAAEEARKQPIHPTEMKTEIATLEEEKKQLLTKIEKLFKQNSDVPDFEALLQATNNLRLQQDEDARLGDNMRKQKLALQAADQKKKDAVKRLNSLRSSTAAATEDAHSLLEQLQNEVETLQRKVQEDLPREMEAKRERVARLRDVRLEPHRTREDVEELERSSRDHESAMENYKKRIAEAVSSRNDGKLANFRQHATMIAKKLKEKEDEMEKLEEDHGKVIKQTEQRELSMAEMLGGTDKPFTLSRDEFKKFGAKLREKTHVYKKQKSELAEIRAESVTLHRTEQILRGRVANLELFLGELEARRGVRGYRDTQDKLERASEQTAEADQMKEKTLDEISTMVRHITTQLKEKKTELAPHIKKLRDVRNQYQLVEADYNGKKTNYDKVAVGLDVERQQLESDCDQYQQEALEEESRFHYLNCLTAMADAMIKRVEEESGWKEGKGRGLLPNFKCYEDLYNNKLAQQQAFAEQLRKQRAHIEKFEGPSLKQRALYSDLDRLLAAKLRLVDSTTNAPIGMEGTEFDVGNARVFTFNNN